MNDKDINALRDSALVFEKRGDYFQALKLMEVAAKYRPHGSLINKKIIEYKHNIQLKLNYPKFNVCHLHIGVHKTATTYLQEQLSINFNMRSDVIYVPLEPLRLAQRHANLSDVLSRLDGHDKNIILSDENILGDCSGFINQELYPNNSDKLRNTLHSIRAKKVVVYLTIRNMANYLSSAYCEYLRWNNFITFSGYTKSANDDNTSWFNIFNKSIAENPDIEFNIFNFEQFAEKKEKLLSSISFDLLHKFDNAIQPSRQKFSEPELVLISGNGKVTSKKQSPFQPFDINAVEHYHALLKSDLAQFRKLKNVKIINDEK